MKATFYRIPAAFTMTFAAITCIFTSAAVHAQEKVPAQTTRASVDTTRTFYLSNIMQPNDANEILVAIRSIADPSIHVYLVASQNAIVMSASTDQMVIAEKIIKDLDRPKHSYRLTYTIAESDAGKRVGVQHYTATCVPGQRTSLKQGSKVPIMTGVLDSATSKPSQQVQYLDIGMNFDMTLTTNATGIWLSSKVEQSSIGQDHSGLGEADPVVRQSVLQGVTTLTLGKASTIGSIDIAGTTRRIDIEVLPELIQ